MGLEASCIHAHEAQNIVRIRIPADVAFNLDKMHKVTTSVLGRLGCPACHSGFDIRFVVERDFVVNSKLEFVG